MNKSVIQFKLLALSASMLLGASAMGQSVSGSISKSDFDSSSTRIKAEYKAEKKTCAALAGNAKDICVAQAKGKESVALAELNDQYKPKLKTHYKLQIARAEASYDVDKQKCDDLAGNPQDVCVKEARAAQSIAKTNASAELMTAEAQASANEKSAKAQAKASSQKADIRSDASADKREAQYQVEKEKCDVLAGSVKDSCLTQAKASFGKP